MRRRLDRLARLTPPNFSVRRDALQLGGVDCVWTRPVHGSGDTLVHIHGGGFVTCSARTHRMMLADLAFHTGHDVLAIEYQLAPENAYPGPIDDCENAYLALLETGVDPSSIVLSGDSAGGNLALALVQRLRDRGVPLPKQLVLISPWVDLRNGGESVERNAHFDYLHRGVLNRFRDLYLRDGGDVEDPQVSPSFANFEGLPPMLIQAGGAEVLRTQIERLAVGARRAGVPVELQIWPGMMHAWHGFTAFLPQARDAFRAIGRALNER